MTQQLFYEKIVLYKTVLFLLSTMYLLSSEMFFGEEKMAELKQSTFIFEKKINYEKFQMIYFK
jgi:hypothetical protein